MFNSGHTSLSSTGAELLAVRTNLFEVYDVARSRRLAFYENKAGVESPVLFVHQSYCFVGAFEAGQARIWDITTASKMQTLIHTGEFLALVQNFTLYTTIRRWSTNCRSSGE
jgi:hypothetical protein